MLNAVVFLLIGLELPAIVASNGDLHQLMVWGAIVSAVVIGVRLLWVFPGAYVPRLLPAIRSGEAAPGLRGVLVVGWSGMRGVVSLAAALALPEVTADGAPFPGRSTIIFITFCVIFSTLVVQGLSLIPLLQWLNLESEDLVTREREVRIAALEAAIAKIHELEADFDSVDEWLVAGRVVSEYTYRIEYLRGRNAGTVESAEFAIDHRLQRIALTAEHDTVLAMRDAGEIPDELFRKIRYEIDLASSRIA
jgi:CPA1 family monovalent cation:H+ antiporter